MMVCVL